jgi:hypothetical protein
MADTTRPCDLGTGPACRRDFYEGDLLLAVIRGRHSISYDHELIARLRQVVRRARKLLKERPDLELVQAKLEQEWIE